MIKAIIFDLDGVLVDTEPLNKACLVEFLAALDKKHRALKHNLQGLNSRAYWSILKTEYELEPSLEELVSLWRARYLAYLESLDQIPVIPGIPALVDYFNEKHYHMAVASSANHKRIDLVLEKIKLNYSFLVIVHGDDVRHSKPAPDCFLLAAQRLAVQPSECVVIEDSTNGVRAAKAAGMLCIGYNGSSHNNDDLSQADILINDFTKLLQSLESGTLSF